MEYQRVSLSTKGARVQFEVAFALTSIIPLLVLAYFATRGFWEEGRGVGAYEVAVGLVILITGLGYALLIKYPLTVIKLRRYLEDMVRGKLPIQIQLDESEDDITSIEQCMNMILDEMKQKVEAMEQKQARLERELCQAHKLQAIGMLASGIAHEINTPIQFVSDNTRFLSETVLDILNLLDAYRQLRAECEVGNMATESVAKIAGMEKDIDLDFVEKEVPAAIAQSLEGLGQAADIARAMKDFSRMVYEDDKTDTDINKAIQTTITVSRNEWKHVAEVKTEFDPCLPLVPCFPGDIKQVLINLIVNAAHAIGDVTNLGEHEKGLLTVSTRYDGDAVLIFVTDTGPGIPKAIRDRVFQPFFTTKKGGKGSGLGLSIARSIVVDKHGGSLTFLTQEGVGTTFAIRLPLNAPVAVKPVHEEEMHNHGQPDSRKENLVC